MRTPNKLNFRTLRSEDEKELRRLHEDWFPIKYKDDFYVNAVQNKWIDSQPLFTSVAVDNARSTEKLVGAIIAQLVPIDQIEDKELLETTYQHTHIMYILTLGSVKGYRRLGVASALVNRCSQHASSYLSCGAIFLHVKWDNTGAMKLYEKHGFQKARYLSDYYWINNQSHGAFLYIKYMNGGKPPQRTWMRSIKRQILSLFTYFGLNKLTDLFRESNESASHVV